MKINRKSKGTPEQMLQAFENKVNELEGNNSVESATNLDTDYDSIKDSILNKLKSEGYDTSNQQVINYAESAADLLAYADNDADRSVDNWYEDTLNNYPEDLDMLPKIEASIDIIGEYDYEDDADLSDLSDEAAAEYIYHSFDNITGHDISEIYNDELSEDSVIFNQDVVDATHDDIKNFIINHSDWDDRRIDNFMYEFLDEYLAAHNPVIGSTSGRQQDYNNLVAQGVDPMDAWTEIENYDYADDYDEIESSENVTAADEIDDEEYLEKLCENVTILLDDARYDAVAELKDGYIYISDMYDSEIQFIQDIEEIEANWNDLDADAQQLADAFMDKYPNNQ